MKMEDNLKGLTRALERMREREKIPAARRRGSIRAQLVEGYAMIQLAVFNTRIGWLGVAYSERGIVALHLPCNSRDQALASLQRDFADTPVVDQPPDAIARELIEYADGQRRTFELKLDWSSLKPFQRAVLQATHKIPFGETRTYGWVAQQIGKPTAARAVGRALATNPIPIILPCHRVLGSDGGLHGYAGGLAMKAKLLQLEGALLNLSV